MRAILYARTSNNSDDRCSIEGQQATNRKYAESIGLTVVGEYSEQFSGATSNRPELNQIVKLADSRSFDVLVVFSADRFARKVSVAEHILDEVLTPNGIALHLSQSARVVNTTSPTDMLMFNIESSFAAYDRANIVERVQRGKKELLDAGIWCVGAVTKFGYATHGKRKNTVITLVESQLDTVRYIFSEYLRGVRVIHIVRNLNAQNIPTRSAAKGMGVSSAIWSRYMITMILRDDAYTGKWHYNKVKRVSGKTVVAPRDTWQLVEIPHTRIISDDDFNRVQGMIDTAHSRMQSTATHEYLLARRLKCSCGYAICGTAANKGANLYYRCISRDEGARCDLSTLHVDKLDSLVWNVVKTFITSQVKRKEILELSRERHVESNKDALLLMESANKVKARCEADLLRILDMHLDGILDRATYIQKKSDIDVRLDNARSVLAEYSDLLSSDYLSEDAIISIDQDMAQLCEDFKDLDVLPFTIRRQIVELLGITGVVHMDKDTNDITVQIFCFGMPLSSGVMFGSQLRTAPAFYQWNYRETPARPDRPRHTCYRWVRGRSPACADPLVPGDTPDGGGDGGSANPAAPTHL